MARSADAWLRLAFHRLMMQSCLTYVNHATTTAGGNLCHSTPPLKQRGDASRGVGYRLSCPVSARFFSEISSFRIELPAFESLALWNSARFAQLPYRNVVSCRQIADRDSSRLTYLLST